MQITRQADYAVRAILYLSRLDPGSQAATAQIARQNRSLHISARKAANRHGG